MATAKKIATQGKADTNSQVLSSVVSAPVTKDAVAKPTPKTAVKATKAPVKAAAKAPAPKKVTAKKSASKPATEKAIKPKKPKLVRDSFTIPKAEYGVLAELRQRASQLARPVKKSELLRAGIKVLASLSGAAFLTALNQVPTIKTGRPTSKK